MAIIRGRLRRMGVTLRWGPTGLMLGDALTKDIADAADLLRACVRASAYQLADESSTLQRAREEREAGSLTKTTFESRGHGRRTASTSLSSNLCLGVAAGLYSSMLNIGRRCCTCLGSAPSSISPKIQLEPTGSFHHVNFRRTPFAVADVSCSSNLGLRRQVRLKLIQLPSRSDQQEVVAKRVTATVHVVKLGLRRLIIQIDDEEEQLTIGNSLFHLENTCGRFFNDADTFETAMTRSLCNKPPVSGCKGLNTISLVTELLSLLLLLRVFLLLLLLLLG